MQKKILFAFLLALSGLVFKPSIVKASHASGGELLYEWVSDSTYKIIFKFYRDCAGTTEPLSVDCCYFNTCGGGANTLTLNKILGPLPGGGVNGQQVSTGCPGYLSSCNGGGVGSNPGYEEWWYTGNVTLTSQCNFWKFYVSIGNRNAGLYNIQQSANQWLYIECTFNNLAAQGNSSPYFTVKPVPYMCVNSPYSYNNGAVDANGDSLSFELIQPLNYAYNCQTNPPYNAIPWETANGNFNTTNNPLATNNTFSMSPTTGQMNFTPSVTQKSAVTLKVTEWRNGAVIGTVMRDVQVIVLPCNSVQPGITTDSSSLVGVQLVNGQIQGCATQPLTFCFDLKSTDTDAILVATDNHVTVAPGSSISYIGQTTDSIRACFSWTPSSLDTGLKIFTITVKDSACDPPGILLAQTFTIPIYIWPITVGEVDTTICFGDSVQMNAYGGSQFTWGVIPGGSGVSSLSCTNCKNPVATPTVTTSYWVQSNLGNNFCNINRDTVTIIVLPPPNFDLGPDTTTCIGNSIQLDIHLVPDPGSVYAIQWTPSTNLSNDTIANPVANPPITTTYVVTVTPSGVGACAGVDSIKVRVLQGFKLFNNDTAICKAQSTQINAIGDIAYTYNWTPTIGVSDPTIINPTITPDTSHEYIVTANFPGCDEISDSLFIDVQPVPTVYVGPDQILCYGDTIHINTVVTPAGYPNYTYIWTPAGALSDPAIADPVYTAYLTTTLTLTVKTPIACMASDAVVFTVVPADFIAASNDTTICPGDTAQLRVTGTPVSLSWVPALYISDSTIATPSVWPVTTTDYIVYGVDINHCIDTQDVRVTVMPGTVINLADSVTIFPGESYQIDPGGNGLYFKWFPPLGLSAANIANPIAMPDVNTRYFVEAATEFGCPAYDSIDVFVSYDSYIDVPNAFSPGSAPNAEVKVLHKGNATLKSFMVFNRWGTKVFETSNIDEGWNGMFNSQPQPMGVYIYTVEAVSPTGRKFVKQGNITLIR
jgi:gliding motility-associated-like protein